MTKSEHARRMALIYESKADQAASSNDPWWLGNLRLYQNYAGKWWGIHYAALREEATQ